MGNTSRHAVGMQMSAFDSAMLMINDLAIKNTELEQKVWELQLALWHSYLDPVDGRCSGLECQWCDTHIEAIQYVEGMLNEA